MELQPLRSLLLVAETRSLTRAATALHLSPAAVYKQLKGLEGELAASLYERAGQQLRLTPAGTALLPFAKSLMAQADAARAAVERVKGVTGGAVRIGTGPAASSYLLPALLKKYREVRPAVELLSETGDTPSLLRKLMGGELDLALVPSALREKSAIAVEACWPVELVLVSKRVGARSPRCVRDLRDFPFIAFQKGSRTGACIDSYFAHAGYKPRIAMRFDNSEAIKAMAFKGHGIAMLPFWAVESDLRQGSISILRLKGPPLYVWLALLRRKSAGASEAVQALVDLARRWLWRNPRLICHRQWPVNVSRVPT